MIQVAEYWELKVEGFPWAGVIMALLLAALMIWAELRGRRNAGEVGSNSAGAGPRVLPAAGPSKTIHERDDRT